MIDSKPDLDRRSAILDAALRVFGRYGYRKTTMNEIAAAADISKPGLYLHFSSKDQIFTSALEKYLVDRLARVDAVLAQTGKPLETRLLDAVEEWFGQHLLVFLPGAFDVIPEGDRLSANRVEASKTAYKDRLAAALMQHGIGKADADDRAHIIFLCGLSWKQPGTTSESFRENLAICVRVCCETSTRPHEGHLK